MKLRNVLSLFDGMSCGQIALKEMGATIENYYAAEIDKHAIQQTQLNFPSTIQLGSVTEWRTWNIKWNEVDLLLGGSPCQGFSFSGKQLAFDDPRSALFFVFVEIWQHIKALNPGAKFLLENVKMKHEFEIVISNYMGIAPIEIDSALVSAQQRIRLYWTNIANEKYGLFGDLQCVIPQPKDTGILLKDILENTVDEKYFLSEKMLKYFNTRAANFNNGKVNIRSENGKSTILTSNMASCDISDNFIVAERGRDPNDITNRKKSVTYKQMYEPRFDGKTNTISTVQKDNYVAINCDGQINNQKAGAILGRYAKGPTSFGNETYIKTVKQINGNTESGGVQPYQQNRIYDINGIAPALHTDTRSHAIMIPEQLTLRIPEATEKGYTEIKPGECFNATQINSKTRRGRAMIEKAGAMTADYNGFMQYTRDYRIRRLTPKECARLQTIPSWYQWKCSDTQAYRMLGNGWTVNVIMHILRYYYK